VSSIQGQFLELTWTPAFEHTARRIRAPRGRTKEAKRDRLADHHEQLLPGNAACEPSSMPKGATHSAMTAARARGNAGMGLSMPT